MTIPDFNLIETMHFDPAAGFRNIDLHRARLVRSADHLGFRLDRDRLEETLAMAPDHLGPLRVRLELSPDGSLVLTHAAFAPMAKGTIWRVAIAQTRLSYTDPLLAHKTSRRDHYNAARAEFPVSDVDEVLLLNEHGDVCEGSFTSLFLQSSGGPLLTPPLEAGLLAGVLRQQLLEEGKAETACLRPEDLSDGGLFVGNSLRGLIPARLVQPQS